MINKNTSEKLKSMNNRQLKEIARKTGVKGFSKLNKEDLVNRLESMPNISSFVNPSWWDKYHNHVYGIVGILIGIVAWSPWNNEVSNDIDTPKFIEQNGEDKTVKVLPPKLKPENTLKAELKYVSNFDGESPYPILFQKIKVGAEASAVKDIYPDAEISGDSFILILNDSLFKYVNFQFENQKDNKNYRKIIGIYFKIEDEFENNFRAEVVQKLQQFSPERDDLTNQIIWHGIEDHSIKITSDNSYIIQYSSNAENISRQEMLDIKPKYVGSFDGKTPYPIQFQKIKVGAEAASVIDIYPSAEISDGGNAFSVRPKGTIFNLIIYGFYFQEKKNRKISSIYFYIRQEFKNQFRADVVEHLQNFEPERDDLTKGIEWQGYKNLTVEIMPDGAYMIREPNRIEKIRKLERLAKEPNADLQKDINLFYAAWNDPSQTEIQKKQFTKKYVGKNVIWTAKFKSLKNLSDDSILIKLGSSNDEIFGLIVDPDCAKKYGEELLSINTGQNISITGIIESIDLITTLKECSF